MTTVVITGLGALTPLGNDVATTWQGLREGRSGIGVIDEDWASGSPFTSPVRPWWMSPRT